MEKKKIIRMEAMVNFSHVSFRVLNVGRYFVAIYVVLADGSRFFIFDHRLQVISFGNKYQRDEDEKFEKVFNQPAIVEVIERKGRQSINLYPSENKKSAVLLSRIIFESAFRIKEDNSFWSLVSESSPENNQNKTTIIALTDENHNISWSTILDSAI